MRITGIHLQGFRAFDEAFELDLEGGKNLLLHGENGSGKSSLFMALKLFFEERGVDISPYRNRFSQPDRPSSVTLHIRGVDSSGVQHDRDFVWNGNDHPLAPPLRAPSNTVTPIERAMLVGAARRSGFLEYRDLLRLSLFARPLSRHASSYNNLHRQHYGHGIQDLGEQIFDVVTWAIVQGVRVAAGPANKTIGELVRFVWEHNPKTRYKTPVALGTAAINEFNTAFAAFLPDLQAKVEELLNHFENHHVRLKFAWQALQWNRDEKRIDKAHLVPLITFRAEDLAGQSHEVLNEARLSAIGLCIFFAAVMLSDTDTNNAAYPRFLVLDDALIGLDLQNRIPVLKILTSAPFKNYQIFLFTHDRVWFDLARGHLPTGDGWAHRELIADETTGKLIPHQKASQSDIERAKIHLANGDLRAAGVYARGAFECRLQNVCEKSGIEIKFKKDNKKISVDDLWQGILARQKKRQEHQQSGHANSPNFIDAALVTDVEMMRSTVLNQLSHANAPGLVRPDVETAVKTIEKLYQHTFPDA